MSLISFPGHGGQRPFQCRYCPYSASQKGNLKTHVLCVHRMPFDNSQYPDRRFKRSRIDSDVSGNSEDGNLPSSGQKNDPHQRFRDSWKGKKDGGELLSTPFKNMTPPVAICPAPLTHRDGVSGRRDVDEHVKSNLSRLNSRAAEGSVDDCSTSYQPPSFPPFLLVFLL
ncbi:hypothetical protein PO909_023742 [Leuciscus waleckii]